jgi:Domain of unknown function (DUF4386)
MTAHRRTALAAGILYLLTFISIPRLVLYGPILTNPDYVLGAGSDISIFWGAILELIVSIAIVGTGVALYPVVKRQSEGVALGFVMARVFEAGVIAVGIISLLTVVTLRQQAVGAPGADASSLVTTGRALVATQNWTFLIGQGLLPGINALLLGSLIYRSGLVPRLIPALGLIGGPLMISSVAGQILGINEQYSAWSAIALLPIFAWELSLGLWLVFRGFTPSAPVLASVASGSSDGEGRRLPSTAGTAPTPGAA